MDLIEKLNAASTGRSFEQEPYTPPLAVKTSANHNAAADTQPIGTIFKSLKRIVSDLSSKLDKKIELATYGDETELSTEILNTLKAPLMHIIRNACDHGIESPAKRISISKPETGTITIETKRKATDVIITISDDGEGIAIADIKKEAIQNNIKNAATIDIMTESEILQLIYETGFSTAQNITAVSGRGIGLDVVRYNIEKLGGSITFKTRKNNGSIHTITLKNCP